MVARPQTTEQRAISEVGNSRPRWARTSCLTLGASCVLMAGLLMWLGRGLTFFYDEWAFIQYRGELTIDALLENHNGHPSFFPVLGYLGLKALVGPLYWPYLACVVALHLGTTVLLYQCAQRRVGAALAAVLACSLLTLGRAWQDLLWGFQTTFLGSLAAGLAAFWFLDRPGRSNEIKASICLVVAVGSSGLGIPMAAAAFVETLLRKGLIASARVMALPGAVYGAWYVTRGNNEADFANLYLMPDYLWRSAEGAVGSLLGSDPGGIAASATIVFMAVLALGVARRRGTARLAASMAGLLTFWSLTALSRGPLGEPTASRYLYPGALFLLLALIELAAGLSLRAREVMAVGLAMVVLAAAWSNTKVLRRGAAGLRDTATFVKAELGALEAVGDRAPSEFRPDLVRMPQVYAGPYLAAIEELGSPADDPATIRRRSPAVRGAADEVILAVLRESGHVVTPTDGLSDEVPANCTTVTPGEGGKIERQPGGRLIFVESNGGAEVRLRRFRPDFPEKPLMTVLPKSSGMVELPEGLDLAGWRLLVQSTTPYKLCTAHGRGERITGTLVTRG